MKATCPNCEESFETNNNKETCCPRCDFEFVVCDETALTMWN